MTSGASFECEDGSIGERGQGVVVWCGIESRVVGRLGGCRATSCLQRKSSAQRTSARNGEERRFGEGRIEERCERSPEEALSNRMHTSLLLDVVVQGGAFERGHNGFSFAQPIIAQELRPMPAATGTRLLPQNCQLTCLGLLKRFEDIKVLQKLDLGVCHHHLLQSAYLPSGQATQDVFSQVPQRDELTCSASALHYQHVSIPDIGRYLHRTASCESFSIRQSKQSLSRL